MTRIVAGLAYCRVEICRFYASRHAFLIVSLFRGHTCRVVAYGRVGVKESTSYCRRVSLNIYNALVAASNTCSC